MISKEILKHVKRIELRSKRLVEGSLGGEYHSVFKGQGMEFAEVRQYVPGDDVRTIDWNVTARSLEPFIKVHIEEREQTVLFLVDASASCSFGSSRGPKSDSIAEVCALLGLAAVQNNDKMGLIFFSTKPEKYIPVKKGRSHALRVIREVLAFTPQHKGTDFLQAIHFLNRIQKRRAIVFLISDFQDFPADCMPLKVASKRHDIICIHVRDPAEISLPAIGKIRFRDAETGQTKIVRLNKTTARQFTEKQQVEVNRMRQLLKKYGIDHVELRSDGSLFDPIMRFFKARERQKVR